MPSYDIFAAALAVDRGRVDEFAVVDARRAARIGAARHPRDEPGDAHEALSSRSAARTSSSSETDCLLPDVLRVDQRAAPVTVIVSSSAPTSHVGVHRRGEPGGQHDRLPA